MNYPSRNNKEIVYDDINSALGELNAEDRGRYFLCTCPACKQSEAFIYKNNLTYIQCNRESECGERVFLQYRKKESERYLKFKKMKETYPELNDNQVEALDWANRAFKHIQNYIQSDTLDKGYRGISENLSKKFIVDMTNEDTVSFMFEKLQPLLNKDYSLNSWMCKRNLVFPIHGEDGSVERILLRSSLQSDIEPKEVQLIVNPSKKSRDFFIDIPEHAETIVISEAILDGMSFREIDHEVGIIALTGSRKLGGVSGYLKENKDLFREKLIIVAMDNDEAGLVATDRIIGVLESEGIGREWDVFGYSQSHFQLEISDPNDFLQKDKAEFTASYKKSIENFKKIIKKRGRKAMVLER